MAGDWGCWIFAVTKVAFNESGNLDQVDVRVEKVNETKGYRMELAVTIRNETRCTVLSHLTTACSGGAGSCSGGIRGGRRTDKSGRRRKGELKKTWVASFGKRRGQQVGELLLMPRRCGDLVGK